MSAAEQIDRVSVEEYLAGEAQTPIKHEYVAGVVYAMAGAKNTHSIIAGNFLGVLHRKLIDHHCQPFTSDTKLRIKLSESDTRFYYPDGMVVCEESPRDETYQDKPIILAEVLSKSTRGIDTAEKLEAYQEIATLLLYLLVEQEEPRVVAYHRTERGFAKQLYMGLDATIPLPEMEADLPLAELYRRVEFTREPGAET